MTAHGSAYTRFRRALATGDPLIVRAAAAELPRISLGDALAVCLVMAEREPDSFPRYAVRWHGRLCAEAKGLTAEEAQLSLAAALSLLGPGRSAGLEALSRLCERHGFTDAADVLDRWAGG